MIDVLLQEMEAYARQYQVPIINAGGRAVFRQVLQQARPHRILEIGTAIGYSALLAVSEGAADAEVTTLELNAERAAEAAAYISRSPWAGRVHLRLGDAGALLPQLPTGFDFVFMDAAKGQYPDYWRKIQPLLAPEAVVVADNVLFRGYVRSEDKPPRRYKTIVKRLREYLALVEAAPGFVTNIYENGDGLAVSRRIHEEK